MTRKRRFLISAGIGVACVGIAIGVLAMLPPRPGVTKANFDRIEDGMSKDVVMAILGKDVSYDLYSTSLSLGSSFPLRNDGKKLFAWIDESGTYVQIEFDSKGVGWKEYCESTETIPDKLRRWLRLPK